MDSKLFLFFYLLRSLYSRVLKRAAWMASFRGPPSWARAGTDLILGSSSPVEWTTQRFFFPSFFFPFVLVRAAEAGGASFWHHPSLYMERYRDKDRTRNDHITFSFCIFYTHGWTCRPSLALTTKKKRPSHWTPQIKTTCLNLSVNLFFLYSLHCAAKKVVLFFYSGITTAGLGNETAPLYLRNNITRPNITWRKTHSPARSLNLRCTGALMPWCVIFYFQGASSRRRECFVRSRVPARCLIDERRWPMQPVSRFHSVLL